MKYADYRIENLTFMKGVDGWSFAEKKEFLETCPENKTLAETIRQLKDLKTAIERGEVKTSRYNEINKNSMKAYLNRHDTNIHYGRPYRHFYCDDSKDFYILADGSYATFTYKSSVDSIIERYENDDHIEHRFSILANAYAEKERAFAKKIETDRYNAENSDRIAANKKLDKVLDALRIEIPASVTVDKFGYIGVEKTELKPCNYWYSHSNYGEILVDNLPLSKKQAEYLTATVMEMADKVATIMDEYRETIKKALGQE